MEATVRDEIRFIHTIFIQFDLLVATTDVKS